MAKNVFAAKTFTLDAKVLSRNLSLWKAESEDKEEARRRPSVRTNTVRYILANFKFQSSQAKAEILRYGNMTRSLLEHVKHDSAELLKETFNVLKTSVLADAAVPKTNKGYLLSEHNLSNIASIYRQEQAPNRTDGALQRPDTLAHEFLLFVCTDASAGILRPLAGLYPPGTDKKQAEADQNDEETLEIDLGLSSVEWYERFHKHVPIRNTSVASFAQTLRPYADLRESELLLKIFDKAPELVADYFFKKTGFAFDPKLTSTWIGYSAFLFSTVQLPVPAFFGTRQGFHWIPPPASIVIESILPQPLSKKILTRCLNQQVELITFFALRLLVVAFQKLQKVLKQFSIAAKEQGSLWEEGASRLTAEFVLRCPKMKDVIGAFRKTPVTNGLQREVCLRLLLLYYEVTPQLAFEEKFDVSLALADAMKSFDEPQAEAMDVHEAEESPESTNVFRFLELSYLLQIARWSPDMRWWQKPESLKFSPFTTLLKVVVSAPREQLPHNMQQLLASIISEHDILQQETTRPAVDALVASLSSSGDWTDELYDFLDDAFGRLSRKPIKYQDDRDELTKDKQNIKPISLLLFVLQEQWPFASKTETAPVIAIWLGRILKALEFIGEDAEILAKVAGNIESNCADNVQKKALKAIDTSDIRDALTSTETIQVNQNGIDTATAATISSSVPQPSSLFTINPTIFAPPPAATTTDATPLHRLAALSPSDAITSHHLPATILLLSAPDPSITRLALTTLSTLMTRLGPVATPKPTAATADSPQMYLLLGILTTTVAGMLKSSANFSPSPGDVPIPYFLTTYAALAACILTQPLHPLYDRICRYHTRAPKWDAERMPSWWAHHLLYTPTDDTSTTSLPGKGKAHETGGSDTIDSAFVTKLLPGASASSSSSFSYTNSITTSTSTDSTQTNLTQTPLTFLLLYIYSSLRTVSDLEILRKRGTLEPILAFASSATLPRGCMGLVLALLWRCTWLEGGSTMLVTRKGVVAWLGGRIALAGDVGAVRGVGPGIDGASVSAVDRDGDEIMEDAGTVNDRATRDQSAPSEAVLASKEGLKALLKRIWETCDRERVDKWGGGMIEGIVQGVLGDGGVVAIGI